MPPPQFSTSNAVYFFGAHYNKIRTRYEHSIRPRRGCATPEGAQGGKVMRESPGRAITHRHRHRQRQRHLRRPLTFARSHELLLTLVYGRIRYIYMQYILYTIREQVRFVILLLAVSPELYFRTEIRINDKKSLTTKSHNKNRIINTIILIKIIKTIDF